MHCFLWRYNDIREMLLKIKEQGFNSIQISPCQGVKDNGGEFWKLYQPLDIKIVDTPLGTKQELENLCKAANEIGINIIADVILRHVAGADDGSLTPHPKVAKRLKKYIRNDVPECDDYNDRYKYTNWCTGMPILDWENEEYQKICIDFLNELKEIGVKGFRLDQLKHYPVESEGSTFLKNVFSQFKDMILYGEIIDCPKEINDMYTPYMKVCGNGMTSDKSKYVTFFDSHDLYYTWKNTVNMPMEMQINEWRFLLQNNRESDALYFPHAYEITWKDSRIKEINNMHR